MEISEELGIKVMPTTLIINKDLQEVSGSQVILIGKVKRLLTQ